MYKLLLVFLINLPINSYAGLFGPSNYDECALDVSKTAKTDMAVRVGLEACRSKFKQKVKQTSTITKTEKCYVYWDGFKLVKGRTKGENYSRYSMPYYGVDVVELALPKTMDVEMGINNLKKDTTFDWKQFPKFKLFLEENFFPTINGLCNL
jgi:hypothetical protein